MNDDYDDDDDDDDVDDDDDYCYSNVLQLFGYSKTTLTVNFERRKKVWLQ